MLPYLFLINGGDWEMIKLKDMKELSEKILYKRVTEWNKEFIELEDGTKITLECTDNDCCAGAYGSFKPSSKTPPLDAVITDIVISDEIEVPDDDTRVNRVEIRVFHNQNVICEGEMIADAGNGGYYYSVGSLIVDEIELPIVSA